MDFIDILIPAGVLAGLGFILGILINVVAKAFYVEEDPSIAEVFELLPKYNCGACGHPGCKEMAISLLNKESKVTECRPIKKDAADVLQAYLNDYFEKKAANS